MPMSHSLSYRVLSSACHFSWLEINEDSGKSSLIEGVASVGLIYWRRRRRKRDRRKRRKRRKMSKKEEGEEEGREATAA